LHHILGLSFGDAFFNIEQYQFVAKFPAGNIIGTGGPYGPGTYYGYFHKAIIYVMMDENFAAKVGQPERKAEGFRG
jgi:hypothetical protein